MAYIFLLIHAPEFQGKKLISISSASIKNYMVDGNELIIEGHYYDIISTEIIANDYIFYCYDDHEESGFHQTIIEDVSSENRGDLTFVKVKNVTEEFFCFSDPVIANITNVQGLYAPYESYIYGHYVKNIFMPPQNFC